MPQEHLPSWLREYQIRHPDLSDSQEKMMKKIVDMQTEITKLKAEVAQLKAERK
jgi:prefoldin subunit 5